MYRVQYRAVGKGMPSKGIIDPWAAFEFDNLNGSTVCLELSRSSPGQFDCYCVSQLNMKAAVFLKDRQIESIRPL